MNRARDHPEMTVKIEVYWLRKRHTSQPGLKVFKSALRFLGHFIFQVSTENTEDGSNLRRLLYSALEKEEKLLVFDLSVLFSLQTCSHFELYFLGQRTYLFFYLERNNTLASIFIFLNKN